jgi:hypothetical protein
MDNQNEKTVPALPSTAAMRGESSASEWLMEREMVKTTVTEL